MIAAPGATVGQEDGYAHSDHTTPAILLPTHSCSPEIASGEIAENEEEEVEVASGDEGESSDDDSDIFVDAVENPSPVVTSPSVSIPAPEGDPPGELASVKNPSSPAVTVCMCVCVCVCVCLR